MSLFYGSTAFAGDKRSSIWPKTPNAGVFDAFDANSIAVLCCKVSHKRFLDLLIPSVTFLMPATLIRAS